MAAQVLTGSALYIAGHDFSCDANDASLAAEVAVQKSTTFCSGSWDQFLPGLMSASLSASGVWSTGTGDTIDAVEWGANGATDRVITYAPVGTEGSVAYLLQGARTSYSFGGAVGEVAPWSISAVGTNSDGMVRGKLMLAKTASISSTGAVGTAVQVGAVAADEFLYLAVHLFPTAGTSITIIAESDATNAFSGAETTRATTGSLTAAGGTWVTRVAGPITDTWYRLNVSAVVGSWTAAASLAVQ